MVGTMKGFLLITKGLDTMSASIIDLKQEVTRSDVQTIIKWMKNNEIMKYLNESVDIIHELQRAVERANMAIMTHLFNSSGSFYLIYSQHKDNTEPVGFLKLVRKPKETEMVIVIGDQNRWGKGLGKASIKKGLEIAFFQWRTSQVIAKINPNNIRSIKMFENLGFSLVNEYNNMKVYSLSLDNFIRKLTKAL